MGGVEHVDFRTLDVELEEINMIDFSAAGRNSPRVTISTDSTLASSTPNPACRALAQRVAKRFILIV